MCGPQHNLAGKIFTWIRSKDRADCQHLYENRSTQKIFKTGHSEINPCKI